MTPDALPASAACAVPKAGQDPPLASCERVASADRDTAPALDASGAASADPATPPAASASPSLEVDDGQARPLELDRAGADRADHAPAMESVAARQRANEAEASEQRGGSEQSVGLQGTKAAIAHTLADEALLADETLVEEALVEESLVDETLESDDRAWEASAAPRAAAASLRALSLPARLEAILYLKGRPLPLPELAEIAGITPAAAELALITLMTDYAHRDTALEIHQEGQCFSLQLREGLGDLVQSLIPVDLSTAALRTLATIALKTRILQSELVELRGSGAYDHIKELLAQDFIERRRQSEGRSYWLSLSEKFHRTFAIQGQENLARPRRRQAAGASGATAAAAVESDPGDDPTSPHQDA